MDSGCTGCQAQGANRASIHDNVIGDNLNLGSITGQSTGDALEILTAADSTGQGLNKIQNLNISHNTFVRAIRALTIFGGPPAGVNTQFVNITVQNNVWAYGNFGFGPIGAGCEGNVGFSDNAYAILNGCVTNYTWDHDAVFNWNGGTLGSKWPTNGSGLGNSFTTGLGSPAWFNAYGTGDSSMTPANYIANPSGALHNAASDGSDIGANITNLNAEISGVASY
jgi:hypothetical protein